MKIFRCIALSLACVLLSGVSGFAYKERVDVRNMVIRDLSTKNDIFLDDFGMMTVGDQPAGYSTYVQGESVISLSETPGPTGKKQTALLINDKVPGAEYRGASIAKSFSAVTSGKFGFEMRFKFEATGEKDYAGFQIAVNQGSTMILRIYVDGTNGGLSYVPGGNLGGKMTPGVWYTLRMIYDVDANTAQVLCTSDAYTNGYILHENLAPIIGGDGGYKIDNINIASRYYTGSWFIDYIRVDSGKNLEIEFERPPFVHPTPIPAPITQAPMMRAVPGRINVNLDGEYMYFATAPEFDGNDLMVAVKSAFRVFGMSPIAGSGGLSAKWDESTVTFTSGSAEIAVGTEKKTMAKAVTVKDGRNLVSLNELAKALGYNEEWNAEENTLYITGGSAE